MTLSGPRPLFTFIHVTDTHLSARVDVVTPFVESVNEERHHPRPDFVVLGGDNIQGDRGDGAACVMETPMLRERLERLRVPCHTICHNHDTWGEPCRGSQYRQAFGDDALTYVRDFSAHFRGLFISGLFTRDGHVVDIHHQEAWLNEALGASKGRRVLVFAHVPLLPARLPVPDDVTPRLAAPTWQASHFCYKPPHSGELRTIIARHGNVVAYYSGHCHVHGARESEGTWYVTTASLVSRPWEYRYVEVYPDRIAHRCICPHGVRGMRVSQERIEQAGLSVEEVAQTGAFWLNCIDANHPTVDLYHDGLPAERDFEIAL